MKYILRTLISLGLIISSILLALYMEGCVDKYAVSKKYFESGALAEESYSVDKSIKLWSDGAGKTIEISPSVVGGI